MKKSSALTFALLLAFTFLLSASARADNFGSLISPGELAKAHEKYEGLRNCVKCHKLGGGIPDANCLDCHDKLAAQISKKQGLHARFTEPCVKCHTDHKGRNHKMIVVDEKSFNHDRIDYRLLDSHSRLACDKCHLKQGVYSGLSRDCASCHRDEHRKQLSQDCSKCHNFVTWKDTKKFSHGRDSSYNLTGKHASVTCAKCHTGGRFKPLALKDCADCHTDKHKGQFAGKTCDGCHTTEGWDRTTFDHNSEKFGYRLEGRHSRVACVKCHERNRFKPVEHSTCSSCHKDEHTGQFAGRTCDACHSLSEGWKKTTFDHASPAYKGYKLEGRHSRLVCDKCHVEGKFRPLEHSACSDCHKDKHQGQFAGRICEVCHSVTEPWKKTSFDHASPSYKGYKLTGKHARLDCSKCHTNGRFRPVAHARCADCHKDRHQGQFEGKKCESCHTADGWKKMTFDHSSSSYDGFRLKGKHKEVTCEKCHAEGRYKPISYGRCTDCHRDKHNKQFGSWECSSCHVVDGWNKTHFYHNDILYNGYKLDGEHLKVDCAKCHLNGRYKPLSSECSGCHRKKDVHKNELSICKRCHVPEGWKNISMEHNLTKFPLVGKHKDVTCEKCHSGGAYKTGQLECKDCHKDPHKGKYEEGCPACHTQAEWKPREYDHVKKTGFALGGAHNDTKCESCHKSVINFAPKGRDCSRCHETTHKNPSLNNADCGQCHSQSTWNVKDFNHNATGYFLSGAHSGARCNDCHRDKYYREVSKVCVSCHIETFSAAPRHLEGGFGFECTACHSQSFNDWSFKHPEGKGCAECHITKRPASHIKRPVRYSNVCETCHDYPTWSFSHVTAEGSCVTCHSPDTPTGHKAYPKRFGPDCKACHRFTAWGSPKFDHSFMVPAGYSPEDNCSKCHMGEEYGR